MTILKGMSRSNIWLVESSFWGVVPPVPIGWRVESSAPVGQLTDNVSKLEKNLWPFY